MGIFDWFKPKGDEVPTELPWERHPSIYEHILAHIQVGKLGLTEGGESLPDDERLNEGKQIRWAAGAMDGVFSHHVGQGDENKEVQQLFQHIQAFWRAPTIANKLAVYEAARQENLLGLVDPVIEKIVQDTSANHQRLYELVESLTKAAIDRGPVKLGVALLGLFNNPDNLEVFRVLGRHEEFTLFAAVALTRHSNDPENELWELAKHVNGWGRIHIVERLAETSNPAIKDWLLREGFRNWVMNEYLAYSCAVAGGLREALDRDNVDEDLLISAGELIDALLAGGPSRDIRDYGDGAVVVELFLEHLTAGNASIAQFLTASAIGDFVSESKENWETLQQQGWDAERRRRIQELTAAIVNRPNWGQRVTQALDSTDETTFFQANRAAQRLDIDTWDWHRRRVEAKPHDSGRWFNLMHSCNKQRIDAAIELAAKSLDLATIATGPGDEMGIGPGFEQHRCLDSILPSLGGYPGKGIDLVLTGLQSPVVRNRNLALRVLSEWGRNAWPSYVEAQLASAIVSEPDQQVRHRMENAQAGKPLESGLES